MTADEQVLHDINVAIGEARASRRSSSRSRCTVTAPSSSAWCPPQTDGRSTISVSLSDEMESGSFSGGRMSRC